MIVPRSHTAWAFCLIAARAVLAADDPESVFFESRIRPVLANRCYSCHAAAAMGGLRLDSPEGLAKGGSSGPAVVAGNPKESLLLKAIRHEAPKIKMPPGQKLPEAEIADLERWISNGAVWPQPGGLFEAKVKPILSRNCYACHTTSELGGLRLDIRDRAMKGGHDGPAIIPGKPDESLLIQAVRRTHERFKMPPSSKLSDEDISILVDWVRQGATWPAENEGSAKPGASPAITAEQRAFWAFRPVGKPALPAVRREDWARTPIDRFVLEKLERAGMQPGRMASKRSLIRRATFDLTGLPPTPEEVDAFLSDSSPGAFANVVDRLLASPSYGERWGRHWLDLARYSDGKIGPSRDAPYPHAYRYRDWVVQALNEDMPYDLFIKAQLAADLLDHPDKAKLLPALGFHALAPAEVAGVPVDDRVDVTTRVFLGLTTGCAQCHDHKFDPIPTKDYYSLLGVFRSSEYAEIPLASAGAVDRYRRHKKLVDEQRSRLDRFIEQQAEQLIELFSARTADYLMAAWKVQHDSLDASAVARDRRLDGETLERWIRYLAVPEKEHPFLNRWYDLARRNASEERMRAAAIEFQNAALSVSAEKKAVDDRNYVKLGGAEGAGNSKKKQFTNLEFLPPEKGYLWRDLASPPFLLVGDGIAFDGGLYYYGRLPRADDSGEGPAESQSKEPRHRIERFLSGLWKEHYDSLVAELTALERTLPPPYPFLHALRDSANPANLRVHIRGDEANLGEEAPRRFLQVLNDGDPPRFKKGSGRLELAECIADAGNPLTGRVIVNRLWQLHFGQGIVRSTGNFGQLGDRPSHPELLDYLAARLVEGGWSLKKLHREMMLSATYSLSAERHPENDRKDPENRLLWRANVVPRLSVEALRDSMLAVSGRLDPSAGGPPAPLSDPGNRRRTIYGTVARTKTDMVLSVFDFPNPNQTAEERAVTVGPLQRLFLMNSRFMIDCAKALASRLQHEAPDGDAARIARAYQLLYARPPTNEEAALGLEFLKGDAQAWPDYAQALMAATEFSSID